MTPIPQRPTRSDSPFRRWKARLAAHFSGEGAVHNALLRQVKQAQPNYLLVLGCGSLALVIALERRYRNAGVFAVDEDVPAFQRAVREARRTGSRVSLDWSRLTTLPFPTASVDVTVGRFLLTRYPPDVALDILREAARVVRPGGEIHLLEHGSVRTWWQSRPDDKQRYLGEYLLQKAGFQAVRRTRRVLTLAGVITLFDAIKPD